jgi:polyketide biosynthesis enoyl-CoA hydratase PksH
MTISGDRPLDLTVEGAIAWCTLARPDRHNALDAACVDELHRVLDLVADRPPVRVLVLGHTGPWFCAGMDFAETAETGGGGQTGGDTGRFFDLLERLSDTDALTIAAVDGRAAGGGVGLAAACDVVLASPAATFTLPEALWGLLPAAVYPFLRRRVGPGRARSLALSTATLSAAQAAGAGLVDGVADPLRPATIRTARRGSCVRRETTRRIKAYARSYDPLPSGAREAAGAALAGALDEPGVRDGIDRWTRTGQLPWE